MSVGESSVPQFFTPSRLSPKVKNATNPLFAGWKTDVPVSYTGGVYRLELNAQLYEGVRYGFLHVNASCGSFQPFTIKGISARAQVKPANWASFKSPNNTILERAWYVGGYTVKLNMQVDIIGSILDQRGDRTPIGKFRGFAGDAHPTQATAMVAFGAFELVKSMQEQLGAIDSVYGTYLMYWVLSLSDYYAATGDAVTVKNLLVPAHEKMRRAYNRIKTPLPPNTTRARSRYAGWDERFNFAHLYEGEYYPENTYLMSALYVQASDALASVAQAVGNLTLAATYVAEAAKMTDHVRSGAGSTSPGDEWWRPYGLHASAHAANAGLVNTTEAPLVFAARFNDSAKICSFSNFNQYFILQGLANLGYPRHALSSIELCWGAELALGATSFWEVSGYGGQWATKMAATSMADGTTATVNGTTTLANGITTLANGSLDAHHKLPATSPPVPGHSSGSDSKCHPWASGVTPWLTRHAAGLRPHPCPPHSNNSRHQHPASPHQEAAVVCVQVQPLLDRVSASLPTPHGELFISADAAEGLHQLRVPPQMQLTDVFLPLASDCSVTTVTVTQARQAEKTSSASTASTAATALAVEYTVVAAAWSEGNGLFDSYVHLSQEQYPIAAEPYELKVRVHCRADGGSGGNGENGEHFGTHAQLPSVYGEPTWDLPLVGTDVATQGAWIGRYGSRGHYLFGLSTMHGGRNLTAPFIAGVLPGSDGGGKEVVDDASVEPTDLKYATALQLSCAAVDHHCADQPRAIGGLYTNFLEPTAVEVVLRPALLHSCVNISLYFVDWTGTAPPLQGWGSTTQRKTALDVFTVNPGVEIDVGYATAVVQHPQLAGGEYRTWRVCADRLLANSTGLGSVRFRLYVVTGNNASVSAIFFD